MKQLMFSGTLLLICIAVMFYLSSGNTPQINRGNLLLWRMTLYATMFGVGWRLYGRFPPYRPAIHRITLWFIALIVFNEFVPEVFR